MTDRDKLLAVFEAFDYEIKLGDSSFTVFHRRYFFNDAGEIWKIIDYLTKTRALEGSSGSPRYLETVQA